jgi:hypothetical protein
MLKKSFDDSFNQDSASESSFNELNDLNVPTTSFNPLFLSIKYYFLFPFYIYIYNSHNI